MKSGLRIWAWPTELVYIHTWKYFLIFCMVFMFQKWSVKIGVVLKAIFFSIVEFACSVYRIRLVLRYWRFLWLVNVENMTKYNGRKVYYLQWQNKPLINDLTFRFQHLHMPYKMLHKLAPDCLFSLFWLFPGLPPTPHSDTGTYSLPDTSDYFQVVISRPLSGMNEHWLMLFLLHFPSVDYPQFIHASVKYHL